MATLQEFDQLAVLIEDVYPNHYVLGFSGDSKTFDLKAYAFNASMPLIHVKETDSKSVILNILWDEANSRKIVFNAGLQSVMLTHFVEDGVKVFKLSYVSQERNCCVLNEISESALTTRLKNYIKTKRFKVLQALIDEFNAEKNVYKPRKTLC